MISLENVSIAHRLFDVTAHIPQGKLVGVLGANGAGKSTLLKAIAGILPPARGQIWLENCQMHNLSVKQRSQKIAYLAQNVQLAWDLVVEDVIALGLTAHTPNSQEQIQQIAEQFDLVPFLKRAYWQLSGGEKARVQLARCCIKQSPILLADEPIATLDPYYQIDIMQQLKRLTPKQSCVVVLHNLSLAYQFCDEIILLDKGRVIASGQAEQVLTANHLATAFGITARIDPIAREISQIAKLE